MPHARPRKNAPGGLRQVDGCAWAVTVQELGSHLPTSYPVVKLQGLWHVAGLHLVTPFSRSDGCAPAGSRCRTATGQWRCASPAAPRCAPRTPAAPTAGRTACYGADRQHCRHITNSAAGINGDWTLLAVPQKRAAVAHVGVAADGRVLLVAAGVPHERLLRLAHHIQHQRLPFLLRPTSGLLSGCRQET